MTFVHPVVDSKGQTHAYSSSYDADKKLLPEGNFPFLFFFFSIFIFSYSTKYQTAKPAVYEIRFFIIGPSENHIPYESHRNGPQRGDETVTILLSGCKSTFFLTNGERYKNILCIFAL